MKKEKETPDLHFPSPKTPTGTESVFKSEEAVPTLEKSAFIDAKPVESVEYEVPEVVKLFEELCVLYRFDGVWNCCGAGKIIIVDGEKKRVVFQREEIISVFDIILNYDPNAQLKEKKVFFMILQEEDGQAKFNTVGLKFKAEKKAVEFYELIKK